MGRNDMQESVSVKDIRTSQQQESDVRSILQEMERLNTLPDEKKARWIWELIQNAKDCSSEGKKVSITFTLEKDKLLFKHNGKPFDTRSLVAIVRKASTKPLNGEDDNTGKFGTGFIITHVLSKLIILSGIHENTNGRRFFNLDIDRRPSDYDNLTKTLDESFACIEEIHTAPAEHVTSEYTTQYEYPLSDKSYTVARDGLSELEKNLPFTLLINERKIENVTIIDKVNNTEKRLSVEITTPEIFPGISFARLSNSESNEHQENGLLFLKTDAVTIGLPSVKHYNQWILEPIRDQARLYRDFPLIGTEHTHFPFFIQSQKFYPAEPRDGVRTKKASEEERDIIADSNRSVLLAYAKEVVNFFAHLETAKADNLYLLAETGLPDNQENYLDKNWFVNNVQQPIRKFIADFALVRTVSGDLIKISECKLPDCGNVLFEKEFFKLCSEIIPKECPDEASFEAWKKIITQQKDLWQQKVDFTIEDLVKKVSERTPDQFGSDWINSFIDFLHKADNTTITEIHAIYPNQANKFRTRFNVRIDPGLDDRIKNIARWLGIDLYSDLLSQNITNKTGIQDFDLDRFYKDLNNLIGKLPPEKATEDQVQAIFDIVCFFKDTKAENRQRWFELINELLPEKASQKIIIEGMDSYDRGSADDWTLKYICMLINQAGDFKSFAEGYFAGNSDRAYQWMNRFLVFAFRNKESKEIALKSSIIPNQNGTFKKLEEGLFLEERPEEFREEFKLWYQTYTDKGDAREILIDNRITREIIEFPHKGPKSLTGDIDGIFGGLSIETDVEEGGSRHDFFNEINNWYGNNEESGKELFPIFNGKRTTLTFKAFGPQTRSNIVRLAKLQRNIDEIEALDQLKLSVEELQMIEQAVQKIGGTEKLMLAAQEIITNAADAKYRKEMGDAAENAFREAINDLMDFELDNPDKGLDFTIKLKMGSHESLDYYVEIKSTVEESQTVTMSQLQGETAARESKRYALCVITRPPGQAVSKEHFISNSKFVTAIGSDIGNKIELMRKGVNSLSIGDTNGVNVALSDSSYSVYVSRTLWKNGQRFSEFIEHLKNHFHQDEIK